MADLSLANVSIKSQSGQADDWKAILRGFLSHGGRVLVEPTGTLSEGLSASRLFAESNLLAAETAIAAHRAYFTHRDSRFRSKVRRAASMHGRRTPNGWRVLEAGMV